jgi:hypothetical protein
MKRYGLFAKLQQTDNFIGLRTRHMVEEPTSGARVMSRLNFTDKILPTPWYMVSFLYRFYNGSSQLKLIPYTANVVAESFLSFDENTISQTEVPETESFGQPLFLQLQQVSNAFEVRTPYYRGIRCDVVGSNQTPILGDVRTNIRCGNRNRSTLATQPSPLFESAGDDFNFFFMIGPPPMCDIKNVTSTSTFPTGTAVNVDLTGLTTSTNGDTSVTVFPITIDPALATSSTDYTITASNKRFLPLALDTGTIDVPITDCLLSVTNQRVALVLPKPQGSTPTLDAVNLIKAEGDFSGITNGPPA